MVLHEKGVDFDTYEVDLKNKSEEFLSVSPTGKVPVVVVDGDSLYESNVVNQYLDEVHATTPLLPEDPKERAYARIWMAYADGEFFPALFRSLVGAERGFTEEQVQEARLKLDDVLAKLEERLTDREYLAGSGTGAYSLADIAYAGNFSRLREMQESGQLSRGDYPNLSAWVERVEARKSYQAAL